MGKLVALKIGDGSFEQGFPVTLQIGEDGLHPSIEIRGKLPPAPELLVDCTSWRVAYRRLGLRSRLEVKGSFVTNVSKVEDCNNAARILRDRLNDWLASKLFSPIKEKILEKLNLSDEVRLLVQTEDIQLQRLPWHLWDLLEHYPKAEIVLSAPAYERTENPSLPRKKISILALLGNSTGIDTQSDRELLRQLPDAETCFLVEPQREALTAMLWEEKGWDILFFAGHSSSLANGETGKIYINQADSLTVEQLKYALKKAVERGLKIAILNSCDGWGLARELASLQIPQIIVMREPVPDKVAQEFLKYFLAAFARGAPFCLAVREARERLQGLEDDFPCASWLPAICQIPAEVPPTWHSLLESQTAPERANSGKLWRKKSPLEESGGKSPIKLWKIVLFASAIATSLLLLARYWGMLQPLELAAFDGVMRSRPNEKPDPRLFAVTITEADIQAQNPLQRRGSLSDEALDRLLQTLEQFQPRAIGLDIYRDFPADPAQTNLAARLQRQERLIATCKVSDPEIDDPGISPPPEIPIKRQGFSDFAVDPDGIVRRHLLIMTANPASPCTTPYAFSVQLAFRYLAAEGILPKFTSDGYLQLGRAVFKPLQSRANGYQGIDAGGQQVLLNYRALSSPHKLVQQVTLGQILSGKIDPNSIKDRIVLIGTTANSFYDYWRTPYSNGLLLDEQLPGVLMQAQMVSQILSAVLDDRPLLWVWPSWGEALWIWGWALLGAVLAVRLKSRLHLACAIAASGACLYGFCFALLTWSGCWVPLVPPALALMATGGSVAAFTFQSLKGLQNQPQPI